MKKALILGAALFPMIFGAVSQAFANAPQYEADPFGDNDFAGEPLILDVAFPSRGRGEVGLMFSSSLIDKYNSHIGGMVEFTYNVMDTLGVAVNFGYLSGALTPIVTSDQGIIGKTIENDCQTNPSCNLTPRVPDLQQLTGVVGAGVHWAPLYGKINLVSELDVNLQLYGILGVGINGTRTVQPQLVNADGAFNVLGQGAGDGGLFGDPKFHANFGAGLKVFVADWLDIRAEFRDIVFRDSFDFEENGEQVGYFSPHYFAQVGVGFILF